MVIFIKLLKLLGRQDTVKRLLSRFTCTWLKFNGFLRKKLFDERNQNKKQKKTCAIHKYALLSEVTVASSCYILTFIANSS